MGERFFLDCGDGYSVITESNRPAIEALHINHPGDSRLYSFDGNVWKEFSCQGSWYPLNASKVPPKVKKEEERVARRNSWTIPPDNEELGLYQDHLEGLVQDE